MKNLLYLLSVLMIILSGCEGKSKKSASTNASVQIEIKQDTMINREILGLTLGETSMDSAIEILNRIDCRMFKLASDILGNVNDVYFSGDYWDKMALVFSQRDKLSKIVFIKAITQDNMESVFNYFDNHLSVGLKNKYRPLIEYADSDQIYIQDNSATLHLKIVFAEDNSALVLSYIDDFLEQERGGNYRDEL